MEYKINEDGCTPGTTGTAPAGATPGNTLGIGNPQAPGENGEEGSGDVLTAKLKKKKKSLKDHVREGLFDVDDNYSVKQLDDTLLDKALDVINLILDDKRVSKEKYIKAYNALRAYCQEYSEKWTRDERSLYRQKDKTVVLFLADDSKKAEYNVLEIRRFIKNPLPYVITIWASSYDYVQYRIKKQNHPQAPADFKRREEFYVFPATFWGEFDIPSMYKV